MFGYGIKGQEFDGMAFGNRKATWVRVTATAVALVYAWWATPRHALAKPREPKPYSILDRFPGLTQTPSAELQKKIDLREGVEAAAKIRKSAVEVLNEAAMKEMRGGQSQTFKVPNEPDNTVVQTTEGSAPPTTDTTLRNPYFAGTMPWHKTFRDVNLCTGNLFKSFADIEVKPGKGQGLILHRTYNSNDDRVGPFGTGWTHVYDIRMEDAGVDADGTEYSPRSDFFGGKHAYTRDADGLYTPPPYLFDELDSKYHEFLSGNFAGVDSDKEVGQDGTVKHFISEGNYGSGHPQEGFPVPTRVCDYIEDRHGNRTELTYTTVTLPGGIPKKLLSAVTDPVGRSLAFSWTNLGTTGAPMYRITGVTGPQYSVSYQYNAQGNLWKVNLDPSGLNRTTTYGYTSVSDDDNHTATGLLSSISDPLGNTTSYTYWWVRYDEYNTPVAYTPTGTVWVGSVTEPAGESAPGVPRSHTWTINPSVIPMGLYVTVQSQAISTLRSMIFVDMQLRAQMVWGGFYTEYRGHYSYTYDTANNVISEFSTTSSAGSSTGQGNQTFVRVDRTFGPHGNVLTETTKDAYGVSLNTTTTEYFDSSKYFQKKKVTDPAGRVTELDYYPKAKNTSNPTDPLNIGRDGQTMWVRDPGYNNTNSTSYQKQIELDYNQYGQKVWEKNLAGVVTTLEYADTWGNLTKVRQDPTGLNRTTQMAYDSVGKVTSSIDPMGHTNTFVYNSLGQPTSASFPAVTGVAPAELVIYSYGANGRTNSVTDNRGTTTMAYEASGDRIKSVTDPVTGTLSYTYSISGERVGVSYPGNTETVTYEYGTNTLLPSPELDKMMLSLKTITDGGNRKVSVVYLGEEPQGYQNWGANIYGLLDKLRYNQTYDANGNLMSYCEAKNAYTGNPARALSQIATRYYWRTSPSASFQNKILNKNDYTYNTLTSRRTANLITDEYNNQRTESYTYDELSRLKTVNYGDGGTQVYSFDSMGNRVSKVEGAITETYTYNNANMLLNRFRTGGPTGQGWIYNNDANGNTLSGAGRTMTWDSQNRMVSCVTGTGTSQKTSTFTYGVNGLRRSMEVAYANGNPTTLTKYVLEGQNVVQEIVTASNNSNPVIAATYLNGPQGPLYRRPVNSADVRWYVYDGTGNVVGEVDATGNLTGSKQHDVYGATRSSNGSLTSKQGWQGSVGHQGDDETGLIYMRARYYAAELGRFQSEDPGRDKYNWFLYCSGDPVNKQDPNGKNDVAIMGTGMGMICTWIAIMFLNTNDPSGGAQVMAMLFALAALASFAIALVGMAPEIKLVGQSVTLAVGTGLGKWIEKFMSEEYKRIMADNLKNTRAGSAYLATQAVVSFATGYSFAVLAACIACEMM